MQGAEIFRLYQSFEEHLLDELLEEVCMRQAVVRELSCLMLMLVVLLQDDGMDGNESGDVYVLRCPCATFKG